MKGAALQMHQQKRMKAGQVGGPEREQEPWRSHRWGQAEEVADHANKEPC